MLRHRFATLMLAFALLGGTVYLFRTMPTGFIPSQDSGYIFGPTMAAQDISFPSLARHQRAVADLIQKDPNVDGVFAFAGEGNTGIVFAMLKPRNQRALSVDQVIAELRPKPARTPTAYTNSRSKAPTCRTSISGCRR